MMDIDWDPDRGGGALADKVPAIAICMTEVYTGFEMRSDRHPTHIANGWLGGLVMH